MSKQNPKSPTARRREWLASLKPGDEVGRITFWRGKIEFLHHTHVDAVESDRIRVWGDNYGLSAGSCCTVTYTYVVVPGSVVTRIREANSQFGEIRQAKRNTADFIAWASRDKGLRVVDAATVLANAEAKIRAEYLSILRDAGVSRYLAKEKTK